MSAVVLPHAPASAAVVRRRLSDELTGAGCPAEVVGDAELVVSELVGNAVRHAQPLPGGALRASWEVEPDAVVLAVADGGGLGHPEVQPQSSSGTSGRGLAIVAALAIAWGVRDEGGATVVWARLRLPARPRLGLAPG